MTKIFFDTEFTGLHQNATLISLGLISECGKTFYAEFIDYDRTAIDTWLEDNVIANLMLGNLAGITHDLDNEVTFVNGTKWTIVPHLEEWLSQFYNIQMFSDCLSYDWVLFNQLFGHAFNLPKNINYIPIDICTMFYDRGIDPDIPREEFIWPIQITGQKHNALHDVKVIQECYNKLIKINN